MVSLEVRFLGILFWIGVLPAWAQDWKFEGIQSLPAAVNSGYEEIQPIRSGDRLYFSRALSPENKGGKYAGSDVWEWRINGSDPAQNLRELNTQGQESIANISADGQRLYLIRFTPQKSIEGLFRFERQQDTWVKSGFIKIPGIQINRFFGAYISDDESVVILSMDAADSRGEEDLYISLRNTDGSYSQPRNLGPSINTSGYEFGPFLSADKRFLFFSSNGHPGFGDADVFVSERLYGSWEIWTVPKNLGGDLNSGAFDGYFSLYNSQFYLTSSRFGNSADLVTGQATLTEINLTQPKGTYNSAQVAGLIGNNVPTRFTFEKDILTLTTVQQETIWYIVSRVIPRENLNIRLQILEDDDPTLSSIRLKSVIDFIKSTGIEGARIQIPETFNTVKPGSKMVVELQFFESI